MLKNKKKIGTASAPDILSYSLICTLYFKNKLLNKYSNLVSSLLSYLSSLSYLVFEVLAPISLLFQKNPADQNKLRYHIRFFIFEKVVSAFKLWKPSCPTNQVYTALAICNSSHKEVSHLETQPFSLQTMFTPLREKLRWRHKGCCWKTYKCNNKPSLTLAAIIRYINLL